MKPGVYYSKYLDRILICYRSPTNPSSRLIEEEFMIYGIFSKEFAELMCEYLGEL